MKLKSVEDKVKGESLSKVSDLDPFWGVKMETN